MTKIVLKLVALVFQRVERLIFNAPAGSTTPHDLVHRAFGQAKVSYPTEMLHFVAVPLPALQKVDPHIGVGLIERQVTGKAKAMAQTTLGIIAIIIAYLARLLSRRHLREPIPMIAFFDPQNVMAIVIDQRANVRGIGTQAVFSDDELEMRVILAQFGEEALGRVAFTVVFLATVLLDDGLRHQRDDLTTVGVKQD